MDNRENSVTERFNSLFLRDHKLARPMDLYNKIHWAIFSLPRYFARVWPLYLYSLVRSSNTQLALHNTTSLKIANPLSWHCYFFLIINIPHSTSRCKSSHAVAQKVVRMSMVEADLLLSRDPDVKIIHLLRDPRGSLLSRMHFHKSSLLGRGEMHNNHSLLCTRLTGDLLMSHRLADKWWGEKFSFFYFTVLFWFVLFCFFCFRFPFRQLAYIYFSCA